MDEAGERAHGAGDRTGAAGALDGTERGDAAAPAAPRSERRDRGEADAASGLPVVAGLALGPDAGTGQAQRLLGVLVRELRSAYRLTWHLGDDDALDDDVIESVAFLAHVTTEPVPVGCERAWLLRTVLRLVGADVGTVKEPDETVLPLVAARSPMPSRDIELPDQAFLRLNGALRSIEKRERAAVLLVVQEGLTMEEGAGIQGGSRRAFARRYASGVASLDGDHVMAMMGPTDTNQRA